MVLSEAGPPATSAGTLPPALLAPLLNGRERFLRYLQARLGDWGDPALAEDVLQDSLLRALRAAPALGDSAPLVPWFYRVLHNAAVDAQRRRAVERRRTAPVSDLAFATAPPAGRAPAPFEHAAVCACFQALLPALRPEYAALVEAIDLRGESPQATAQRLGITPNNLKVRHHRARQALRRRLEETCRLCAAHHCLDCTCRSDRP